MTATLPSGTGYNVGDPSSATVDIIDDDSGPPTLSVDSPSVLEGGPGDRNTLDFTTTLSHATSQTVTVNYIHVAGTATISVDYENYVNGSLTFQPGETSKTVSVPVYGDNAVEPDEIVHFGLQNPSNAVFPRFTGGQLLSTGTILNDDTPPTLTVSSPRVVEGDPGDPRREMVFTATLSHATSAAVTGRWLLDSGLSTANVNSVTNPATAPVPTTATDALCDSPLSFTIPAGQTQTTYSVWIVGDNREEPDETVEVFVGNLTNTAHANNASIDAVGTIVDDDAPLPVLTVSSPRVTEGYPGGQVQSLTFTATLDGPAGAAGVQVDYRVVGGTATAGTDFLALSPGTKTLTIPAGSRSASASVGVFADGVEETPKNETVVLEFSNLRGAMFRSGTTLRATGTIEDDDGVNSGPQNSPPEITDLYFEKTRTGKVNDWTTELVAGETFYYGYAVDDRDNRRYDRNRNGIHDRDGKPVLKNGGLRSSRIRQTAGPEPVKGPNRRHLYAPNVSTRTCMEFTVTAVDRMDATATRTKCLWVSPRNPTADPRGSAGRGGNGPHRPGVLEGETGRLNSGLSYGGFDYDGSPVLRSPLALTSYRWEQVDATPETTVTLSSTDTARTTFTAPQVDRDTILKFRLTVKDEYGHYGSRVLPYKVVDHNDPPYSQPLLVHTGPDAAGCPTFTLDAHRSGDSDGIVSYKFIVTGGGAPYAPGTTVLGTATVTDPARTYVGWKPPRGATNLALWLTVTDGKGKERTNTIAPGTILGGGSERTANCPAAGTPPTGDAGPDMEASPGERVTLRGTGSVNPHGTWNQLAHEWEQVAGTQVALEDPETGTPSFTVPMQAAGEKLVFRLAVTDRDGESDSDTTTVAVRAEAEPEGEEDAGTPPEANAGPDLEATPGTAVTLQGTGSVNPHGQWWRMAHLWTQTAGPEVSLSDVTKGDPAFTVPGDMESGTVFAFSLTVTDKDGETDTDRMQVIVVEGTPPTANAGPDLEADPGETVTLQGKGSHNPHGRWHRMAHLWTQTAGPEVSLSDVTKGDPAFTVPGDTESGTVFAFSLTVTDKDGEIDTDSMTVTVLEGTPPTANAGPDLEADPGESVTLQGKGSHNPHGRWHRMAHLWAQHEGPEVSLSDATKGDPSFTVPANAAPGTAFRFVLTVTDRDGETDSDSMTVTVRGTPPTANAGPDLEAAPGETVTLQGTGSTNPHGEWWRMDHLWTQVSGPPVAFALGAHRRTQFAGRDAETFADPSVTLPADAEPGTVVELALTVTDRDGESDTDTMTVTVRASAVPMVSVADARAEEDDGWIAFDLTLDAPAPARSAVEWATHSGTATGGLDYRHGSGTIWFAEGATTHKQWVRVFDDAHDEGEETFTLTLSKPQRLTIGDGEATGTIANTDPLLNAWLARFGRTVAGQTVEALTERFATPAGSGSHVTLGGQRIGLDALGKAPGPVSGTGAAGGDDGGLAALAALARDGEGRPGAEAGSGSGIIPGSVAGGETRSMTGRDLLLGSAFHLSAGGGDGSGPRWTGWGRAALERFENSDGGLPVDGEVMTGVFGADWERGRWLAGVALSHSIGEGEMRPRGMAMAYDLDSTVTAVHPYVRVKLTDRVSAWGLVGYGRGDLTVTQKREATADEPAGRTTWKTGLAMTLGALGARGALLTPEEADGFGLALKGDAFLVRTTSDRIDGVEGLGNLAAGEADASRLRLVLEGSREMKLGEDPGSGTLTPSLEIGARHDGGDAETGMGLEIGGGLRYADPSSGVSMDLKARGLLAHEESGYREWGVSGALRLAPGASGRGLSLSLTPAFGADAGSADRLWSARDAAALAADGSADPAARMEMEVGYGLSAFDGGFTGTPYAGFGYSDTDRRYRLGWRLTRPAATGSFQFSLEASRRETANDGAPPDHGIGFRFTSRW